jgi:hypothetical protein
MGYASVKAFFDSIVAQLAATKKVDIKNLFQGYAGGAKVKDQFTYFGASLSLLTTDVVLFQGVFNWKQTGGAPSAITFQFYAGGSSISPVYDITALGDAVYMNTPFLFIYLNPTQESALFRLKVLQNDGNATWNELTLTSTTFRL